MPRPAQLRFDAIDPIQSRAVFDPSGRYRYWLSRTWDPEEPVINFCMLNPSTADEWQDDPTVARCIRYARRWGFGHIAIMSGTP